MNMRKFFAAILIIPFICGMNSAYGVDGDDSRDHVRIEKTMPGGTKVTVVEGLDPNTGRRFVEKTEVTTTTVRAEVDPEVRIECVEVPATKPGKARLAVLPAVFSRHFQPVFKFSETIETSGQLNLKMIFTSQHESRMEAPSFTLSLAEAFVASRKFDILERSRLNEVLKEIDFGESDYGDQGKVVPIGKALNAEYVVLPEIELIHIVAEMKDVPYVDSVQTKLKGKVIVRLRVTDTATTRTVEATKQEVQVERRLKANDPFLNSEIQNLVLDLYKAASLRAMYSTLDAIYPVRILDVEAGKAVLNRGEGAISVGDEFDLFSLGRAYTDTDTGEMLGRRETKVASIKVSRVAPKFSEADILDGADRLTDDPENYLCRETTDSIEAKTRIERKPINW